MWGAWFFSDHGNVVNINMCTCISSQKPLNGCTSIHPKHSVSASIWLLLSDCRNPSGYCCNFKTKIKFILKGKLSCIPFCLWKKAGDVPSPPPVLSSTCQCCVGGFCLQPHLHLCPHLPEETCMWRTVFQQCGQWSVCSAFRHNSSVCEMGTSNDKYDLARLQPYAKWSTE